jgi:hypothetical protein
VFCGQNILRIFSRSVRHYACLPVDVSKLSSFLCHTSLVSDSIALKLLCWGQPSFPGHCDFPRLSSSSYGYLTQFTLHLSIISRNSPPITYHHRGNRSLNNRLKIVCRPNVMVDCLTLLPRIWEVQGSNLSPESGYPESEF